MLRLKKQKRPKIRHDHTISSTRTRPARRRMEAKKKVRKRAPQRRRKDGEEVRR